MDPRILIVGAGHAGSSVAALLRQHGFGGPITLIGDELMPPYQRPPLSKSYLTSSSGLAGLRLRSDEFYREQDIALRLGTHVASIDPGAKFISLGNRDTEHYDILILATGSRNRPLKIAGRDVAAGYSLRTVADAARLKVAMQDRAPIVIVGGGYIGLEVAASARKLGMKVTVLERAGRVLARVASEPISQFFTHHHRDHGVEIVTNADIVAFSPATNGAGGTVELADGRAMTGHVTLIGVGASACDALALAAGLRCMGGIVVNEEARTSDPHIFAIGDATVHPVACCGRSPLRLESVSNALDQARHAVAAILGKPPSEAEVPWFWSEQFDLKLQIAGLPIEADKVIVRGDPSSPGFAVFHLRGDRVRAVEAINATPEFMVGRQLIAEQSPVRADWLADTSRSMRAVRIQSTSRAEASCLESPISNPTARSIRMRSS